MTRPPRAEPALPPEVVELIEVAELMDRAALVGARNGLLIELACALVTLLGFWLLTR